jgi:hypothetical protein
MGYRTTWTYYAHPAVLTAAARHCDWHREP